MSYLRNGSIFLKRNSTGSAVQYIQQKLGITSTSVFDDPTEKAVKSFQKKNKLGTDGIVGPITFVALMSGNIEINFSRSSKTLTINLKAADRSHGINQIFKCKAISGLPKAHSRIKHLIAKGRDDLSLDIDYMQPEYDEVSDVGPIPNDTYSLKLQADMPFQKTGDGWGVGGWYLDPGILDRLFYRLDIGRGGFFLHHDGNGVGTGGCIGVSQKKDMLTLKKILTAYQKKRINSIDVLVR